MEGAREELGSRLPFRSLLPAGGHSENVPWSTYALGVLLFLATYWLLQFLWDLHSVRSRNLPPGPWCLPFVGNAAFLLLPGRLISLLWPALKGGRGAERLLTSWRAIGSAHLFSALVADVYGNVFSLFGGRYLVVFLNDFDTVKDALVNYAEAFSDRPNVPQIALTCERKAYFAA